MVLCLLLLKKRVHYLPAFTAVFILTSVFISYGVSVSQGHVERVFPFISHTAVKLPERCVFAQLINIGAFLLGANVFVRYMEQSEQLKIHRGRQHRGTAKDRRLCIASLVVGWLSALGLCMVANFQVVDVGVPHYVGTVFAFLMGLTYTWIQTSISFRQQPRGWVAIVQLLDSIFLSLCLVVFIVSFAVFEVKNSRGEGTKEGVLRPWYLASMISEWVVTVSVVFFVLTFCPSFSRITLQGPRVLLLEDRTYVTANDRTNLSRNGDVAV